MDAYRRLRTSGLCVGADARRCWLLRTQEQVKKGREQYEREMEETLALNEQRKQLAMEDYMQRLNTVSQENQDKVGCGVEDMGRVEGAEGEAHGTSRCAVCNACQVLVREE